MSTQRLYHVVNLKTSPVSHRLIWGVTPHRARSHAAADTFTVEVAGQQTLIDLLAAGIEPEFSGAGEDQLNLQLGEQ